jgi:Kelch motif
MFSLVTRPNAIAAMCIQNKKWRKQFPALRVAIFALILPAVGSAQPTWTPLTHPAPFGASTALLLTDGTVIVQQFASSLWYRLTPDQFGSYVNGTWSSIAPLPAGYAPYAYASAVLADGRVIVIGGEYNLSGGPVWTNQGAIYNPMTNTWTDLTPNSPFANIGDAQSTVLPNGKFLLASPFDTRVALLDPATLMWSNPGSTNKADRHDEENWTLLPDGRVLTVDAINAPNSEIYNPATGQWSSAGSTINSLSDPASQEVGPALLRPNGTVFATGAMNDGTHPNTAIYNVRSGIWSAGPRFPNGDDIADGPAALLPNGNVLVAASPGVFHSPTRFYEFDGTNLTEVVAPPHAPFASSYFWLFLLLPTGQILATDGSNDVEIYTAVGTFDSAWRPTIANAPTTVVAGNIYSITGTQFNGLSEGSAFGDDAQSATNYPLVRITNHASGHVQYARTHGHSTMGVATGPTAVSTNFDAPAGLESGPADLVVVANGIPSLPVVINSCTAPVISDVSASPDSLWPPNHKLVDVTINYTATAACSVTCTLSVSSNEPGPDEWVIVDAHHLQLLAERNGNGSGRIYTNTISCSDSAGTTNRTVNVVVPHDQGH